MGPKNRDAQKAAVAIERLDRNSIERFGEDELIISENFDTVNQQAAH